MIEGRESEEEKEKEREEERGAETNLSNPSPLLSGIQAVDITRTTRTMGRELGERVRLLGAGLLLTYRGMFLYTSLIPDLSSASVSPPSAASPSSVHSTQSSTSSVPSVPPGVRDAWRWAAWEWEAERRRRRRRRREHMNCSHHSSPSFSPFSRPGEEEEEEGGGWWKGMMPGTITSKVSPSTWGRALSGLGSLVLSGDHTLGKSRKSHDSGDEDEDDDEVGDEEGDEALAKEEEEEDRSQGTITSSSSLLPQSNGQEHHEGQDDLNILNDSHEGDIHRGRWLTLPKERDQGRRAPLVSLSLGNSFSLPTSGEGPEEGEREGAKDPLSSSTSSSSRMLLFQGSRGALAQIFLEGEGAEDGDGEEVYGSLAPIIQEGLAELEDQVRRDRSDLRRLR